MVFLALPRTDFPVSMFFLGARPRFRQSLFAVDIPRAAAPPPAKELQQWLNR